MRAHRVLLVATVVASWAGCFKSLDIPKIPCDPAKTDSCPSGYACTPVAGEGHLCRWPPDAAADVPAVVGEAGAVEAGRLGEVGSSRLDGPRIDGAGEAGGSPRIDGALDSTADGVADIPLGGGETGAPDLPSGTGGVGGGDVPVSPPVDSGPDVPVVTGADVADVPSSGGAPGTGGASGTGGAAGTGGSAGTGGAVGTGGATGTGGSVTTGGAPGTGGTTTPCQEGATECSGNGVRTCASGQWGAAVACGPRQTCTGPAGTAQCTCNVDPVCTSVGGACSSLSVLASCTPDAQACLYQSSATTCANGACYGPAGAASCCTNACVPGATCLSGTTIETCAVGANGCTSATTTSCTNGACFGPAGAASCCTNACTVGTNCLSGTTLQTCALEANGCTASAVNSTCASGLVCERIPPAACQDPTWAEWPMPNGQADVAAGAPNLASYTDNGDGTVTDNLTRLMWQQAPVTLGAYTWEQAKAYCSTVSLGGHNDWRLPTRIELVSLVDFGRSSPAMNTTYFTGTPNTRFWSSSPSAGSPSNTWYVDFSSGQAYYTVVSATCNARCVR